MAPSWTDFPAIGEMTMADRGVYEGRNGRRYIELPENGWGALLAWSAGPGHVVRCLDRLEKPPVVTTVTGRNGTVSRSEAPRTDADQAEVDQAIDEYLADAEVPSQPHGWRWFLALPPQCATARDYHRLIDTALRELPKDLRPLHIREVMERVSREAFAQQ
jgi:hypothetical protein